MSPFLIFFLVVTFLYVLYYAAIITMDMNAKPKDAVTQGETMEAPDGMQTSEDNDDTEEEPTSREADDENGNDNPEGSSEDETADNHQEEDNPQGTYMNNDVPPTEHLYEPEPETPEDDDVYGIDKQMAEEQSSSHEAELPSPEDNNPSYSEETPSQSSEETSEPANTDDPDNGDGDEESEEAIRAMILKEMQERAKADGAEFVEAEVHDKNEFDDDEEDDLSVVEVNSQNCDTGRAADINASSEPIITESMTPVRQDRFAKNIFGAMYKMKGEKQNEPEPEEKPTIKPDNIEKEEHITNA